MYTLLHLSSKLKGLRYEIDNKQTEWMVVTPASIGEEDNTRKLERERRHLLETRDNALHNAQLLETRLGISKRWTRDSAEWRTATEKFRNREYQRSVDVLEGLLVARIQELAKMNLAQTGPFDAFLNPFFSTDEVDRLQASSSHRKGLEITLSGH